MSNIEILRQHLLRLYKAHLADDMIPTSNRFLFYELVQEGIVPKHASGVLKPGAKGQRRADQNTIDALTSLRERGEIPWQAIVDETRRLDDFTGFKTITAGVDAFMNAIRLDPWKGNPPLILTESRSLAGVLRELLRDYAARIASTNGQVAGFLHRVVGPALEDGARVGYLGDYDLAGGDIEENTRRVLERYAKLDWVRLALTEKQVANPDYKLIPLTKHDERFNDGGAHQAVETEALSQRVIVQIVRDWLDALLPQPLDRMLAKEERERRRLRKLLQQ
jgi:hypothetical protein